MSGSIPYWGANGVVDFVDREIFDEELVLLGEDGAPFDVAHRDVAFLVNEPVWVNNHIHVLRPSKNVSAAFLTYALNATNWMPYVTGSTRLKLTQERMMQAPMPEWSLSSQRKIADFLDRETERIDALIDKKRRLIDLLEEKRTATITQAVTKGLDPTVPMKPSNIPWIGSIPAHWETTAFRHVCRLRRGFDLPETKREDGIVPLVSSGGVTDHVSLPAASGPGVVTGRYGSVGTVHWVEEDYWPLNTTLYSAGFGLGVPRYVFYLLGTMPLLAEAGKSAVPGISRVDIDPLRVPIPDRREQAHIVGFLDTHTEAVDRAFSTLTTQLTLLAEYREALITAAVTGEIDVDTFDNDRYQEEVTA